MYLIPPIIKKVNHNFTLEISQAINQNIKKMAAGYNISCPNCLKAI